MESSAIDFSFLDHDDELDKFVNSLFSVFVVVFDNDNPDIAVHEVKSNHALTTLVCEVFPEADSTIQMIIPNPHSTSDRCPYFRIIMDKYNTKSAVNYKLETFLKTAGITNVSSRCTTALVNGLDPIGCVPISIPSMFRITSIEQLCFIGDLDMTCLQSACVKKHVGCRNLMDIPGIPIPDILPRELDNLIFSYLRHPVAECFKDYHDTISDHWTRHFNLLVRYARAFPYIWQPVSEEPSSFT